MAQPELHFLALKPREDITRSPRKKTDVLQFFKKWLVNWDTCDQKEMILTLKTDHKDKNDIVIFDIWPPNCHKKPERFPKSSTLHYVMNKLTLNMAAKITTIITSNDRPFSCPIIDTDRTFFTIPFLHWHPQQCIIQATPFSN